jgi:Protein of unknown function (DUF2996)
MAEETNQTPAAEPAAAPAAKAAKKEKPAGPETKPFAEFMEQDYLPAIQKAISQVGISDLQLSLVKQKFPVKGMESVGDCWQMIGSWQNGLRQFNVYFPDEDIQGKKGFSCSEGKKRPSTLESFLIDERKMTLDLMVWGLIQRLNGQKWLSRN